MDQKQAFCKRCGHNVLATRKGVNHTFHLVMTCVTVCAWGLVWLWLIVFGGGSWRCPQCGSKT